MIINIVNWSCLVYLIIKQRFLGGIFLLNVIRGFKDKAIYFNFIEELNFITIASKLDMSNDFYNKHNMCALVSKLNAMVNKNKNLINKLDRSKRHPLIRKFSLVPFNN